MERARRKVLGQHAASVAQPSAPAALINEPEAPPVKPAAKPEAAKPKTKKKLAGYVPAKPIDPKQEDPKKVAAVFQRLKERLWQACEIGDHDTVFLVINRAEKEAEKQHKKNKAVLRAYKMKDPDFNDKMEKVRHSDGSN